MRAFARSSISNGQLRDELFLDLFLYHLKPPFGANSTILEVFNLGLELVYPIFGGSQLDRNLVRHAHGAVAIVAPKIGYPLKHSNDPTPERIHQITVITRLFLRRKPRDLVGRVGRARIHANSPTERNATVGPGKSQSANIVVLFAPGIVPVDVELEGAALLALSL